MTSSRTYRLSPNQACTVTGCAAFRYAEGLCRLHWLDTNPPPLPRACDRCGAASEMTQMCAPCGERLCSDCYSPWTALACPRCRLVAGAGG